MIKRCFICIFLVVSMLLLTSCGTASPKYMRMKKQGYYPTYEDFPNTKWMCQEMDMYFCMLEHTNMLIGEYTVDGATYSFSGNFWFSCLHLSICSSIPLPTSEGFLEDWDWNDFGFHSTYIYEDGVIKCTEVMPFRDHAGEGAWPEALTFVNTGNITQISHERWYAKEIDMYMDSFEDVNNFYKGKLVYNGETYGFEAYQRTLEGTYEFEFYGETIRDWKDAKMRLVYDKKSNTMIGTLYTGSDDIGQTGPKITFTKEKPQ